MKACDRPWTSLSKPQTTIVFTMHQGPKQSVVHNFCHIDPPCGWIIQRVTEMGNFLPRGSVMKRMHSYTDTTRLLGRVGTRGWVGLMPPKPVVSPTFL